MPNHLMEFIPAIYRGINVDNTLPCLEAADWIEEQGSEAWAKYIRKVCDHETLKPRTSEVAKGIDINLGEWSVNGSVDPRKVSVYYVARYGFASEIGVHPWQWAQFGVDLCRNHPIHRLRLVEPERNQPATGDIHFIHGGYGFYRDHLDSLFGPDLWHMMQNGYLTPARRDHYEWSRPAERFISTRLGAQSVVPRVMNVSRATYVAGRRFEAKPDISITTVLLFAEVSHAITCFELHALNWARQRAGIDKFLNPQRS